MNRRRFLLTSLAGALAAPLAAEAQQVGKISIVGVLAPSAQRVAVQDVFEQALQDHGWIKGKNLRIDTRAPTGPDRAVAQGLTELIGLGANVLVVWGTVGALAAKQATTRTPVVFLATGDPVALGLVLSLAHPGGNLTGVPAIASSEEFAKRLALLKETVPSITRVAVLVGPDGRPLLNLNKPTLTGAANLLGIELYEIVAATSDGLEGAVREAKHRGAQALYVWPSSLTLTAGKQLSALALASHLPSVHPFTENAVAGGLFSYAASLSDIAKRGALFVDKILRGGKPGDLPVEQPTKFELVINLKTAKALGLTIPPSLLLRADQVIE